MNFLKFNLAEFNINQDFIHTTPASPSMICICCLATNVHCIKLINCKHVSFFESFFQDKMECLETVVCYQCHGLLEKFDLFRQQVEESLNILNNKPQKMTVNKFQNITLTPIKMLSVSPIDMNTSLITAMHKPSHHKQTIRSNFKNYQINTASIPNNQHKQPIIVSVKSEAMQCETTTDIKIEDESCSDIEIDEPLLESKDTSIEKIPKGIKFQDIKDMEFKPVQERYKLKQTQEVAFIPVHENYKGGEPIKLRPAYENNKRQQLNNIKMTELKPVQESYKGGQPIELRPVHRSNKGQQLKDIKITELKPVHESYKANKPIDIAYIPPDERYEWKVKIITLTKEELMSERDRKRLDEKYLKLPYKCETCITAFDYEIVLKDHMTKRHTLKPGGIVCDLCQIVFGPNAHAFKVHYKRHFTRYDCVECGKRYLDMVCATTHCSKVHGNLTTTYQCRRCEFTTESYQQYRSHSIQHRKPVPCPKCNKEFATTTGRRMHMLQTHEKPDRVHTCDICGKEFRLKVTLGAHRKSAHSGAAEAYCAPCKMHFRSETGLSYHLKYSKIHSDDNSKRFECDECGKRYPLKGMLFDHINGMHLKRYWYHCNKCDKKFLRKTYLRRHNLTMHKEGGVPRNKICHYCGRGFTTNHTLESHIRTHTSERPLQCARCPATFAHAGARYNHNKLVHLRKRPVQL